MGSRRWMSDLQAEEQIQVTFRLQILFMPGVSLSRLETRSSWFRQLKEDIEEENNCKHQDNLQLLAGVCISLKRSHLAVAVECCLLSFMKRAFCCDNYKDEAVLQELMSR
ncbi:structural maintenance of chromosomes protein 6-like protein [Lates japonicus]|uniref:Structural maintenance of chromosomes protein 6-like protein n=1 Tax=Lates japonicus TaxID=270547 RepID=A0AAD3M5J7_LATJO|nr:structural maintenance of chromosomes protein 6-like protein [Lates japonicus]